MAERTSARFFLLGFALLMWASGLLVAGCVCLILNIPVGVASVALGSVGALALTWWACGEILPENGTREFGRIATAAVVIIVASLALSALIYDASWDGQGYQSEGALAISRGWNPYREDAPDGARFGQWLAFFSKGAWIPEGSLVALTGDAEAGKAPNLVLMAACFALAVPAAAQFGLRKRRTILFLAALIALNPVGVAQAFTYYVDGQLGSALSILVCLLLVYDRFPRIVVGVGLVAVTMLAMSLKLNGAIYATVIVGGYAIWHWAARRSGGRLLFACGVVAYTFGIFVLNFNPFVTQYARQALATGNPFHPTTLAVLTHIEGNTPPDLRGRRWPEKFVESLFARYATTEVALKIPFMLTPDEIFWTSDARVGAFGPFFSAGLIFAAGAFVLTLRRRAISARTLVLVGVLALSAVSSPEAWWARYVPQLWLLVVLLASTPPPDGTRWAALSRRIAFIALGMNIILLTGVMIAAVGSTSVIYRGGLKDLREHSLNQPIDVDFQGFALTRWHFAQYGIRYNETVPLPCAPDQQIKVWPSEARICRSDG